MICRCGRTSHAAQARRDRGRQHHVVASDAASPAARRPARRPTMSAYARRRTMPSAQSTSVMAASIAASQSAPSPRHHPAIPTSRMTVTVTTDRTRDPNIPSTVRALRRKREGPCVRVYNDSGHNDRASPMIVTVTANAAVDKTLTVANLQLGHRHRAQAGVAMAGGKGINVARVLKNLGEPVIATGLAGGRNGAQIIDSLVSEGLLNDFVRIGGESRTSTAVIDPTSGIETEINEYGPRGDARGAREADGAAALPQPGGVGGGARRQSAAQGLDELLCRHRARSRQAQGAGRDRLRRRADATGARRPNRRWCRPTSGRPRRWSVTSSRPTRTSSKGLHEIADMGAERVLITLKTGCYALLRSSRHHDRLFRAWIPRQESVSSVGLGRRAAGRVPVGVAGRGVARAMPATALWRAVRPTRSRSGAGVFDLRDVTRFAGLVEVQEIHPQQGQGVVIGRQLFSRSH